MRSNFGFSFFKFIGDKVQEFLFFTDNGTRLVFGESFEDHFIAFKVNLSNVLLIIGWI